MNQIEFDFGVCALADYDEDGHAQIQTDSPGIGNDHGTQPGETILPYGYYASPLDPELGTSSDVGLGATALIATAGDIRHVMPLHDPRDVPKLPKLKKGGTMVAGGAGEYRSFCIFDGLDPSGAMVPGSFSAFTPYAKGGSKSALAFLMNVRTAGAEEISIIHGEGHRITLSAAGSRAIALVNAGGDAFVSVDDDGVTLAGATRAPGSMIVGTLAAAMPVASAPAVAAALAAIVASINALAAACAGIATLPSAPSTVAPLAATLAPILAKLNTVNLKAT